MGSRNKEQVAGQCVRSSEERGRGEGSGSGASSLLTTLMSVWKLLSGCLCVLVEGPVPDCRAVREQRLSVKQEYTITESSLPNRHSLFLSSLSCLSLSLVSFSLVSFSLVQLTLLSQYIYIYIYASQQLRTVQFSTCVARGSCNTITFIPSADHSLIHSSAPHSHSTEHFIHTPGTCTTHILLNMQRHPNVDIIQSRQYIYHTTI